MFLFRLDRDFCCEVFYPALPLDTDSFMIAQVFVKFIEVLSTVTFQDQNRLLNFFKRVIQV